MKTTESESAKWSKIRPALLASYDFSESWSKAVSLYRKRIEDKFLNPTQKLIDLKNFEGEGFTIVGTQCILIESFAAFRAGKVYRHKPQIGQESFYYNNSGELFVKFLKSSPMFDGIFFGENKASLFSAEDFYSEVRCGLLHEARTKGKWTINQPLTKSYAGPFIVKEDGKLKIFRTLLQSVLRGYLDLYCGELQVKNETDLRRFFARKMDDLFDVTKASTIDWWIDK